MEPGSVNEQIASALHAGDIRKANELLGKRFAVSGTVVHGNHLGRKIGFPTANVEPDAKAPIPVPFGVYAVQASVNGRILSGMANIGIRPTIDGSAPVFEVNLFEFDEDIYGTTIEVFFVHRIRDERKFSGLEALVEQINKDKSEIVKLFGHRGETDSDPKNTLRF